MPEDERPDTSDVAKLTTGAVVIRERSALPRTLMGGTESMRAAREIYLPRNPAEHPSQWLRRLNNTFLFNGFEKTIQMLLGKVFSKDVTLGEDMHQQLVEWTENIDLEGRTLTQYAEDWLEDAMLPGLSHTLVDFQRASEALTLEEQTQKNLRPYFTMIPGDSVVGWRAKRVNNVMRLTQFRFEERQERDKGQWGSEEVNRIRVFYAGDDELPDEDDRRWVWFEVYEQDKDKEKWFGPVEAGPMRPFTEIPLVTLYTGRTAYMMARPPLDDLAWKNVEHWNSSSEQRNILHVARVPILFGRGFKGVERTAKKTIASLIGWFTQADSADLKYVEHQGRAIEAGANDLKQIVEEMSVLAVKPLLERKPGAEVATGRMIDTLESDSRAQAWTRSESDALTKAMGFMAVWGALGEEAATEVTVNTDFGIKDHEKKGVEHAMKARQQGDLTRGTLWKVMDKAGMLPEDFDPLEEEMELAEKESEEMEAMERRMAELAAAEEDEEDVEPADGFAEVDAEAA